MALEDVPEQGRRAMLEEFGCRRPDKRHYMDAEGAQRWLRESRARHDEDTTDADVYHCCEAGWVFGRRPKWMHADENTGHEPE